MAGSDPRLYADNRGVWREDRPGYPFGIEWDEIVAVGGHKLDGITEVYTVIELDFVYGESLALHADWPGFLEVVQAITEHLPGIPADWLTKVERLEPQEVAVTVWRRV